MTTATIESTRRPFGEAPTSIPFVAAPATPRRRSLAPVFAMAAGLSVLAAAGTLTLIPNRVGTASRPLPVATAAPDAAGITLAERDVSVVTQVYEPGHDSGWHSHPGIHAVALLSGSLTVYDSQCRPTTYGPGQPYVGGRDLHLVRNEAAVPVEMSVTYLNPSAPTNSTQRLAAPPGCVVAG